MNFRVAQRWKKDAAKSQEGTRGQTISDRTILSCHKGPCGSAQYPARDIYYLWSGEVAAPSLVFAFSETLLRLFARRELGIAVRLDAKVSPRQRAQLAFGSAIALLLVSGGSAHVVIARLLATQQSITHTHEVQHALSDVRTFSGRAGFARTEYLDSGDSRFLQQYESATDQVHRVLRSLRFSTADNPAQQNNCTHLESLMDRRSSLLAQSIALKRSGQGDSQRQA